MHFCYLGMYLANKVLEVFLILEGQVGGEGVQKPQRSILYMFAKGKIERMAQLPGSTPHLCSVSWYQTCLKSFFCRLGYRQPEHEEVAEFLIRLSN